MNRRLFLQSAASAVVLPSVIRSAEAAAPSLGFSLYGMKTIPLDVALKTCAEIGYSHVELALNAGYPTEPKVFGTEARKAAASQMDALKLSLPCLMINISLTADDKAHSEALKLIATAGQMAHEMFPAAPPLLETVLGGKPATWETQKAGMLERLFDWAAAAEKAKVQIAVKAIGINRAEVMFRNHAYLQEAEFPSRLGYEAAGTVAARTAPGVAASSDATDPAVGPPAAAASAAGSRSPASALPRDRRARPRAQRHRLAR
jgi:hypothetical protein